MAKMTPAEKKAKAKAKNKEKALDLAAKGPESEHFAAWIKSSLRSLSRKWPSYYMLYSLSPSKMIRAETSRPGLFKVMRHWQCADCGNWFQRKLLHVDHKIDVGSPGSSPEELGRMAYRLFATIKSMQLLCAYRLTDKRFSIRSCHTKKTHGDGPQGPKEKAKKTKPKKKAVKRVKKA